MIESGGKNIGCPWHGLLDVASKQLATDSEPSRIVSWGGEQPAGGDCFLVSIPGLPEPITPEHEHEAGMRWKNYALLSGGDGFTFGGRMYSKNHVLHGKGLGRHEFIYIDPAGAPWLMQMPSSGTRVDNAVYVSVRARRFGTIGRTAKVFDIGSFEVPFTRIVDHDDVYAPSDPLSDNWQAKIMDIDTNGANVLIGVPKPVGRAVNCGCAAVVKAGLSGTPGVDFSVELDLVADEAGIDFIDSETLGPPAQVYAAGYRTINWGDPPLLVPPFPGHPPASPGIHRSIDGVYFAFDGSRYATTETVSVVSDAPGKIDPLGALSDGLLEGLAAAYWREGYSRSSRVLLGGRFDSNGGVDLCVAELNQQWDCSKPTWNGSSVTGRVGGGALNPAVTATATVSKEMQLTLLIGSKSYSSYVRLQGTGSELGRVGYLGSAGGGVPPGTRNGVISASWQAAAYVDSASYDGGRTVAFQDTAWPPYSQPIVYRFSNSVFSLSTPIPNPEWNRPTNGWAFDLFIGKLGELSEHLESGEVFATEHPVTGTIEVSDSPVAWL